MFNDWGYAHTMLLSQKNPSQLVCKKPNCKC